MLVAVLGTWKITIVTRRHLVLLYWLTGSPFTLLAGKGPTTFVPRARCVSFMVAPLSCVHAL